MKYFRNIKEVLLAAGFLLCVNPSNANEFYLLNLSLGDESNVPRGIDDFYELDSAFVRAAFTAGRRIQLGFNGSLNLSGDLGYQRFDSLRGFDRVELGAAANYRYKLGFVPYTTALNAGLRYNLQNSQGQARDSETAQFELSVVKR